MILRYGERGCGWAAVFVVTMTINFWTKVVFVSGSAAERSVLGVVTPDTLGMGEEVAIRWNYDDGNGGSTGRFDIALYKCDTAFCGHEQCGNFVEDICDKPKIGCADAYGGYTMTVPTNVAAADSYKIRVGLHGSSLFDCTSSFAIVENIPVPSLQVYAVEVAQEGQYTLDEEEDEDDDASFIGITSENRLRRLQSSSSGSPHLDETAINVNALGTDAILVSWKYDDGFGGSFARFNIDLYYCGGGCSFLENCGEFVARLCEGCPDSSGDEYVVLPNPYSSHNYKVRVSTWENVRREVSACSPKFEIQGQDRPTHSTPSPAYASAANRTSLFPRIPGAEAPVADLPSTPIVKPDDFPDWGDAYVAPTKPECAAVASPDVRYAVTTARIYIERSDGVRGGCFTLTQIWNQGRMPLYPINPGTNERVTYTTGVWLLTEELYVLDGVTLEIHGIGRGGDCDELRLLSDKSTFINLRAHGGSLSFLGTKVISWDEGEGMVDTNHEDGRSYISAVSEVIYDSSQTCEGNAKEERGESRMDIIDSEIGYLGYHESESYGLVWKVRGFCVDKSNLEVFDSVNVYGDMINSNIHHNYFGLYSYGHQGGNWNYNKMHDNVEYGFDPHDDSDYITITGNDVWGNGNHGIIASKRCDHVTISGNHVSTGFNAGLFLHRSSDIALVSYNHVHNNGDAGLAVLESFHLNVNNNVFKDNRYGIRFSVGAGHNWVHNNVINNSYRYNLFTYLGSDLPDVPGTTGYPVGNVFWRNYFSGTYLETFKLKEADDTAIVNNRIRTAASITFEVCSETTYRENEEEEFMTHELKQFVCFTENSDLSPVCE